MTNRTDTPRLRDRVFPSRVALAIALVVCVVVPIVLVSLQIHENPKFSPIDEGAHFDYVDRVAEGSIPRQGQRLLRTTMRELVCTGTDLPGLEVPPCDAARLPYDRFPGGAHQYEAQQPPTYYAITVPLRWVTENVLQVDNKLDATRATGIFWLVAGLLLLWAAGRLMDVDVVPLGAVLLLLAVAPLTIYHASSVSNDATAIFSGGFIAFIGALAYTHRDRRLPAVILFLAGAFVVSLKTTNMFPVVAVAALFAVAAIADRTDDEAVVATFKRWWHVGGWLLLGGGVAGVAWVLTHRALALIPLAEEPTFGILRVDLISKWDVLPQAATLFSPLTGAFVSPGTLDQNVQKPFYVVLAFLLVAGALAGLFTTPRRWNHWLGLLAIPLVYAGGVVFGVSIILSYEADPGLSGRYGLSIAPLLILVLGASLVGRWAVRAVGAFSVAMALTIFAVLVT